MNLKRREKTRCQGRSNSHWYRLWDTGDAAVVMVTSPRLKLWSVPVLFWSQLWSREWITYQLVETFHGLIFILYVKSICLLGNSVSLKSSWAAFTIPRMHMDKVFVLGALAFACVQTWPCSIAIIFLNSITVKLQFILGKCMCMPICT